MNAKGSGNHCRGVEYVYGLIGLERKSLTYCQAGYQCSTV